VIYPIGNRLLVWPQENEPVTQGGIIVPQRQIPLYHVGKVVAAGEGQLLQDGTYAPPLVKEGETILYNGNAATEIVLDRKYHLIDTNLVYAVVRE